MSVVHHENKSGDESGNERVSFVQIPPKHNWLFLFFEDPHSGYKAKRFADLMTVVVLGSIVVFCLETENVSKSLLVCV